MKSFISTEAQTKDFKKNNGVHFKNGDIALCIDIFSISAETFILHKNFKKTTLIRFKLFYF